MARIVKLQKGDGIRLPRKVKKKLINDTARAEYLFQVAFIKKGWLSRFVL